MVKIKLLFLFATSALAVAWSPQRPQQPQHPQHPQHTVIPGHSPGYELILSDLNKLDQSVKALIAAIQAYTGGAAQATSIFSGLSSVETSNRMAYNDAKTINVQNAADSQAIFHYVSNPIAVDVPSCVKALSAKKQVLVNAGLRQKVLDGLNLMLHNHESLGAAMEEKMSPLVAFSTSVPVATIDFAIRGAIANFQAL